MYVYNLTNDDDNRRTEVPVLAEDPKKTKVEINRF